MATLRDIADVVGVSPSTVSLVLNGRDQGRVRPASAARIREVAEELDYVPNLLAQGLRTRQSKTLGVLADGVAGHPFSGDMLAGAQDAAWHEGYLLLIIDIGRHTEMQAPAVRALLQRNVEALILAADFHRVIRIPLAPPSVPHVLLNARPAPPDNGLATDAERATDWIVPDEESGAYAGVRHLIAAGHRRIAICSVSDPRFVAAGQRLQGYRRALEEAGIVVDESLIRLVPGPETADGITTAHGLLALERPPTAVFCFSDRLAMAFYQAAHQRQMQVPDDLSVVGFDNQLSVADALAPGLTTIQLPHRKMGEWATQAAIRRIRRRDAKPGNNHLLDCPLVPRGSVAAPAF